MTRAAVGTSALQPAHSFERGCVIGGDHKEIRMGRGDNRLTPKMKRKRSQAKLKARIKRKIDTARAAKKPAAPSKKK